MSIASRIFLCILIVHRGTEAEPLSGWVEPASPKEFPFVVSISRKFDIPANNPYGHTCGGALIKSKFIITSASCFLPGKTASDYFVFAGSSDLSHCSRYEIKAWTTYDDWSAHIKNRQYVGEASVFAGNDIAIVEMVLRIKRPADTAELWDLPLAHFVGAKVMTAGWGLLFDDTIPQNLLKADLYVLDDNECKGKIRTQLNNASYNHETNLFCTNAATLFATLDDGDRGSPVFVDRGNGDYQIIGINLKSAPAVDTVVEKPDQQNLHLLIHHYVDFIKVVVRLKCI